jgi:CBS domain-containing protein
MPYEVRQLIRDLGTPVLAEPDEPIQGALDRMLHHGFSQLPVIKNQGQSSQFYFVTFESILLALDNFGSNIRDSGLHVDDALVKISNVYRGTDDLFELLAGMRETNAGIIVDDERNLTHVVTTYDTTRYFRQWAEDIMQVRDVEHSLKRIINSSFKNADGEIDETVRRTAIEEITSSKKDLRKKFVAALRHYLTHADEMTRPNPVSMAAAFVEFLADNKEMRSSFPTTSSTRFESLVTEAEGDPRVSEASNQLSVGLALRNRFESAIQVYLSTQASIDSSIDVETLDDAFKHIYDRNEQIKEFSELTLSEYITLFFKEVCWHRCQPVIRLKEEEVRHMLEDVRETRNILAHFREEAITAQRRLQLKRCADWLSQRESLITSAFDRTASS